MRRGRGRIEAKRFAEALDRRRVLLAVGTADADAVEHVVVGGRQLRRPPVVAEGVFEPRLVTREVAERDQYVDGGGGGLERRLVLGFRFDRSLLGRVEVATKLMRSGRIRGLDEEPLVFALGEHAAQDGEVIERVGVSGLQGEYSPEFLIGVLEAPAGGFRSGHHQAPLAGESDGLRVVAAIEGPRGGRGLGRWGGPRRRRGEGDGREEPRDGQRRRQHRPRPHRTSSANVAMEPLRTVRASDRRPPPGISAVSERIRSRKSFRLLRITTCGDSLFTGGGVTPSTRNL